jgi:hypothetical protein
MFEELRRVQPGREGVLFIKASNQPSLRAHRKMGMREVAQYVLTAFLLSFSPTGAEAAGSSRFYFRNVQPMKLAA